MFCCRRVRIIFHPAFRVIGFVSVVCSFSGFHCGVSCQVFFVDNNIRNDCLVVEKEGLLDFYLWGVV